MIHPGLPARGAGLLMIAFVASAAMPACAASSDSGAAAMHDESVPAAAVSSRWGRLFAGNKNKLSGALSFSSGLKDQWLSIPNGSESAQRKKKINQLLNLSLQYSPYSYWFANVTLRAPVTDFDKYATDFRYSFGYDDWHPNTFSLVYSNYGDNRLFTSGNARHTYFEQGAFTFAYKFSLPKDLEKHLLINKGDALTCQVGVSWVPRYYSLADNDLRSNKEVGLGGCGYTFKQHFFIRATAFWFPHHEQQQPWNGDYSYSFGYATYKPGSFSIQYSNYSGTRFPGRSSANAKFREGTISLIWFLPF